MEIIKTGFRVHPPAWTSCADWWRFHAMECVSEASIADDALGRSGATDVWVDPRGVGDVHRAYAKFAVKLVTTSIVVGILEFNRRSIKNPPLWTTMGLSIFNVAIKIPEAEPRGIHAPSVPNKPSCATTS